MTQPELAVRVDDRPDQWHRLSPWMMAVRPLSQLPQLIPVAVTAIVVGDTMPLASLAIVLLALVVIAVVPWLTTSYQVTDTHVRLRTGLLNRKVATARRDRIRSVDLTASAPLRILGLKKVVVGTGTDEGNVILDCVPVPYALAVQEHLMPTATAAPHHPRAGATAGVVEAQPSATPVVLARFRPEWLRFAPLSLGGFLAAAAAVGFAAQFAGQTGIADNWEQAGATAVDWLAAAPVLLIIAVGTLVALITGAGLSAGSYVLANWGFTLSRHPDKTLRTARGLISTSATTLDEERLRGVHLHEPVLLRPFRGARLAGIATGSTKHPLLLPSVPRAEAARVAGEVANASAESALPLPPHGRAARRRRLVRGALSGAVPAGAAVAAAAAGWLAPIPAIVLAVLLVGAGLLAGIARYRHLGTLLTDRLLVVAPPRLARHRYLVDCDGIVGWQVTSSPFQRRQGVATLTLATAAGSEGYAMVDLPDGEIADVVARATPGLVAPFLIASR